MTTKSRVVKFSPFEALLIGEKNKIVTTNRRTKNATFIAKALRQRRKTFNLRDLFDLDGEDASWPPNTDNKDKVVFKMPQRVREFLKARNRNGKPTDPRNNQDLVYFDCNPKRMLANNARHSKSKNAKVRSKKIKFKRRLNTASKTSNSVSNSSNHRPPTRVVKKFPSYVSRLRFNRVTNNFTTIRRRLVSRDFDRKNKSHALKITNRHMLRGADGKFISKKDYNQISSANTSTVDSEESSLFSLNNETNRSKKVHHGKGSIEDDQQKQSIPSPDDRCGIHPNRKSPHSLEDHSYRSRLHFHFPKYPPLMKMPGGGHPLDEDQNLMDVIYENFPPFAFGGGQEEDEGSAYGDRGDFADVLRTEGLLPPEKHVKMYEKKKNGFFAGDKLTDIFNNHLPYIKLRRMEEINSIYGTKGFPPVIDEPCTKKNHLIKTKSFDCFFLRSSEGKEIVIGNLMKPFWPNSWFGRLPNI